MKYVNKLALCLEEAISRYFKKQNKEKKEKESSHQKLIAQSVCVCVREVENNLVTLLSTANFPFPNHLHFLFMLIHLHSTLLSQ